MINKKAHFNQRTLLFQKGRMVFFNF